jgi:hypothetical protein
MIAPFPPPTWTHQPIVLYHGTLTSHADDITKKGINLKCCKSYTDFGRGFYTTTSLIQAQSWAWHLAAASHTSTSSLALPAQSVVMFTVDREALGELLTLAFVRGDWYAEDYWSLVFHCRSGLPGHGLPKKKPSFYHDQKKHESYYDVVYGPIAAFWPQRSAMHDSDQISFHTDKAVNLLNNSHPQIYTP